MSEWRPRCADLSKGEAAHPGWVRSGWRRMMAAKYSVTFQRS